MLKLNNRGWGLGVLFAFLLIFILAIIIISVNASDIGIG